MGFFCSFEVDPSSFAEESPARSLKDSSARCLARHYCITGSCFNAAHDIPTVVFSDRFQAARRRDDEELNKGRTDDDVDCYYYYDYSSEDATNEDALLSDEDFSHDTNDK